MAGIRQLMATVACVLALAGCSEGEWPAEPSRPAVQQEDEAPPLVRLPLVLHFRHDDVLPVPTCGGWLHPEPAPGPDGDHQCMMGSNSLAPLDARWTQHAGWRTDGLGGELPANTTVRFFVWISSVTGAEDVRLELRFRPSPGQGVQAHSAPVDVPASGAQPVCVVVEGELLLPDGLRSGPLQAEVGVPAESAVRLCSPGGAEGNRIVLEPAVLEA
jgi:hypothetical protein